MPLNDGNIDSEDNFHNDDCANAALEDVMAQDAPLATVGQV